MAKFKKGDRVKVIHVSDPPPEKYIGTFGTVDEDDSGAPWVLLDLDGERYAFSEHRLAAAEPAERTILPIDSAARKTYPDNNPKTAAGALKAPLHLVPPSAIHYLALALADGAAKYGPYNWRDAAISASVYRAARLRHEARHWDGENEAPDSRINHLAHIMACCAIELDAISVGCWIDDRPTQGGSPRLQDSYVQKATP